MMGVDPERAAAFMVEHGADIVALNCGTGMDMERARQAVERYKRTTVLPVMVFRVLNRSLSEIRMPVATLITAPLTSVSACDARSAPSTTLVT